MKAKRALGAIAVLLACPVAAAAQEQRQWADCGGVFSTDGRDISGFGFTPGLVAYGRGPFRTAPQVVLQTLASARDPGALPPRKSVAALADEWVRTNFPRLNVSTLWWAVRAPHCGRTLAALQSAFGPGAKPGAPVQQLEATCSRSGGSASVSWSGAPGSRYVMSVADSAGAVFGSENAIPPLTLDVVPGVAYEVSVTGAAGAAEGAKGSLSFLCPVGAGSTDALPMAAEKARETVLFDYRAWCHSPGRDGEPRSAAWIANCLAANSKAAPAAGLRQ